MFESLDIRHWLIIALLILINVVIFGCIILLLTNKIVLPT
jgi:Sec-independent protein translocase protein TatA